ncbi:MAG: hypothetical protein ACYCXN_13795, partial [Acidimicrobiales bacterium]
MGHRSQQGAPGHQFPKNVANGDRPLRDRPSGDRPSGDRPSGDRPSGDRPSRDGARVCSRLAPFGTTIFAEMSALALKTGSVNLGQGFPDGPGPELLRNVAMAAIHEGDNQYPPGIGVPELLEAVAAHQ